MRALFKNSLRSLGLELVRHDPTKVRIDIAETPHAKRAEFLKKSGISLVFDVGAHKGWYSADLRTFGYDGKIVSYEPQALPYKELEARSASDPKWEVIKAALGDKEGTTTLHVSEAPESSSLLDILPTHTDALPESKVIGSEEIPIHTLDNVFGNFANQDDKVFLKLDVQGFEKNVLAGAKECLKYIQGIQMEMSLKPLYNGEALFSELHGELCSQGFRMVWLEPGFKNEKTDEILQVDGIFLR